MKKNALKKINILRSELLRVINNASIEQTKKNDNKKVSFSKEIQKDNCYMFVDEDNCEQCKIYGIKYYGKK